MNRNLNIAFYWAIKSWGVNETDSKIRSFATFSKGWHRGFEGLKFKEDIIASALAMHSLILATGFRETGAFPGLNGEIQIVVYDGDHTHEFTLEANGKWDYVREYVNQEAEERQELSFEEVAGIIQNLSAPVDLTGYRKFNALYPHPA